MLRPDVLVLIILLIGYICVDSQDWEDPYQQWKLIHKVVCLKKPKYGKCRGHREMWYFDVYKMKCKQFTYSNCGGNSNRFFTQRECDEFCTANSKDLVKHTS